MVSSPKIGSAAMGCLRQGGGQSLRLRRQRSLPNIFYKEQGHAHPRLAEPPSVCIPSCHDATAGHRKDQGIQVCSAVSSPPLENPVLVPRALTDAGNSPLADSPEERPHHTGEGNDFAPLSRFMGPPCMTPQRVPGHLPDKVLKTILEARAPSTRRLYAQKWVVFAGWCAAQNVDPPTSEVPSVLTFLQGLLNAGRIKVYTLKVYVAPITAFHTPIANKPLGRNKLIARFLKGARRLNPPPPPSVPIWDLSKGLEAMKGPSFKPLLSVDLKSLSLSLKTAFLLVLASVKRVGDLQALSISVSCLEFGPNDSKVVLKPRHCYVPNVLSTPFRAQVISLAALSSPDDESDAHLLCPIWSCGHQYHTVITVHTCSEAPPTTGNIPIILQEKDKLQE
ncbi:hypothetical protein PO909_003616 [Leuciscus waleckii]